MKTHGTTCKGLAQWLRIQLETELPVGADVHDFMKATFGTLHLEQILANTDDSETDSLLELIFFPDSTFQTLFETRWGHLVFSSDDRQAVIADLSARPLRAALRLPGRCDLYGCPVPEFALENFVQRLNITWQPQPELNQALQQHLTRDQRTTARVLLRHAQIAWHDQQVQLAALFVRHMPAQAPDYPQCLEFLLSIASELGHSQDLYAFLAAKKLFYFQSLCKAEDFERRRSTTNMEILMLQGERAAHGDIDQWRRWMRMIDRVCLALFERTEFFHQPTEHSFDLQPDSAGAGPSVQSVIRILS